MIYDVRQTTTYHYALSVAYSQHVLRLTPVDRSGQHVHAASLTIAPQASDRREGRDFFGNRMTWLTLETPHDTLSVRVAARVLLDAVPQPDLAATPAWEAVRDRAFASADLSPDSPAHFLFASRQVSLDPDIRDYVAESFSPGRAVADAAMALTRRIKDDFIYEIGATTVTTTPPMSFALRRGVCQDFAHIMISGLRGLGVPAGYVSGYLRTLQSPQDIRLTGADAMHAWVTVWCGEEAGWIGFDPTNGILAGLDHVVLAIGRDYADVAPIDGVVLASGGQRLSVAVSVTPVG
ncbi:MAG: transglutaminase N-terminal domain-containing protein [Pseudorhodoplanes sp.]